jgi:hypothetical protein
MAASSQGATVSFRGTPIGQLTGFSVTPGRAVVQDVSSAESLLVGASDTTRLIRQFDCLSVEPGRATYSLLGVPPHNTDLIGISDTLAITYEGGSFTGSAFLESFEITGSVGELLRGSATFIINGDY